MASFSETSTAAPRRPILTDKLFFFVSGERNRRDARRASADGYHRHRDRQPADAAHILDFDAVGTAYDPGPTAT